RVVFCFFFFQSEDGIRCRNVTGVRRVFFRSVQLWSALASATSDTGELNDWVFGMPESTIRADGPRHAAQRVVDWADAEYLSPKVTSVTDEDARSTFTSGHSAFLLANSRHVAQLSESMGENVGFFLLPPAGSGAAA